MQKQDEGLICAFLRKNGAVGRNNAIPREETARGVGLSCARMVSKALEEERQSVVICSCERGLFLPTDDAEGDAEIMRYIQTVSRKGAGSFRSLAAARRYLRHVRGQQQIRGVTEEDGN